MDSVTIIFTSIIVPFIIAIAGGGGAAWLLMRPQKEKLEAETTEIINSIAKEWIEKLTKEVEKLTASDDHKTALIDELSEIIDSLKERVVILEGENLAIRNGGMLLEGQVEELGGEPVWRVPRNGG